jgi:hypothetical protein
MGRVPPLPQRHAEAKVAPDRGGITVFQGSMSHQPPQQVNLSFGNPLTANGGADFFENVGWNDRPNGAGVHDGVGIIAADLIPGDPSSPGEFFVGRVGDLHATRISPIACSVSE